MAKKATIVISVLLLFVVSFAVLRNVGVGEGSLNASTEVKVNHVAGKVEKLQEKTGILLKFNKTSKAERYQYLSEKRLAELTYVIENDQINLVEETASRYSTYIGTLANYVVANQIVERKGDIISMYERHGLVIVELQKRFEYETAWWLVLQHDMNTISILKERVASL